MVSDILTLAAVILFIVVTALMAFWPVIDPDDYDDRDLD